MKILTVIPLKKGVFKSDLTYFTAKDAQKGDIVTIPLRNKKCLGLVIGSEELSGEKSSIKKLDFNLRKIIDVKEKSIFRNEYLEAALIASSFFISDKSATVASLIPSILKDEYDKIARFAMPPDEKIYETNKIKFEKYIFQSSSEERISSYKTLIRELFAEKKSVFMVLPTEHDIEFFEELLSKGIEQFTCSLHAKTKKLKKKIEKVMTLPHPMLILGTAPFLSVARPDLGAIILEHESSSAYKTIGRPHLDLRIFAEIFASMISARFIMADTILRFETVARREIDGLTPFHPLSFRVNFDGAIEVPEKKPAGIESEKFKIIKDESIKSMQSTLARKKSVFIFSLRRGLATETLCRDCGNAVACENCGAPL